MRLEQWLAVGKLIMRVRRDSARVSSDNPQGFFHQALFPSVTRSIRLNHGPIIWQFYQSVNRTDWDGVSTLRPELTTYSATIANHNHRKLLRKGPNTLQM